jgi:DNA-binding Xre family transcriptional regulator
MSIQSSPTSKIDLSALYPNKEKYRSVLNALDQSGSFATQSDGTPKITSLWQGAYQTHSELIGLPLKKILKFGAKQGWLEESDKALVDSLAQKCKVLPETLLPQKSWVKQSHIKEQKIEENEKETKGVALTLSQMILVSPQKEEVDATPTDYNSLVSSVPLCNPLPAEDPGTEAEIKQIATEQLNLQIRLISINLNCISQQILKADHQELLTLQAKVAQSKKTLETIKREVSSVTIEKLEKFCDYLLKEIEKIPHKSPQKKEIKETRETTKKQAAFLVEKVSQLKTVIEENSKNLTAICEPLSDLKKLFYQNKNLLEDDSPYIQVFEEFNLKQIAEDLYGWYLSKREEIFEEYIKPALDPQNCSSELLLQSIEPWKIIYKAAHTDQERQAIYQGLGCMYETLYKRESDKNTENARSYISSALYWFFKASVFNKHAVSEKIINLINQAPIYIDNESYLTREQLEELERDFFIENKQNSEDQQINSLVNQENQVPLLYQVALMSQFIDNKEISTMILFLKWITKNEPSSKNKETLGAMSDLLSKKL